MRSTISIIYIKVAYQVFGIKFFKRLVSNVRLCLEKENIFFIWKQNKLYNIASDEEIELGVVKKPTPNCKHILVYVSSYSAHAPRQQLT